MGAAAEWVRLKVHSHLANTVEDIDRNIEAALDLNLPPLQSVMGKEQGTVSVVGSGPSLKANWRSLKRMRGDIVACNASCQFLLERGIVPKYMMCFDADPLMLEFITPHPDITYLLSSRCPPKAFKMLKDCKVVCWHAGGDEHIEDILVRRRRMEPLVKGGTAAITRAMILVLPMGYTDIHLWGADSSFSKGETHIRQSTTLEKRMMVSVAGRAFECAPWMAQQAEDFKVLAPIMAGHKASLTVHGDGLIPQIAASMGFHVDWRLRIRQFVREWAFTAREVWNVAM